MRRFRQNPARVRAANIRAERARRTIDTSRRLSFTTDPLTRRFVRPLMVAIMATAFASSILVISTIGTPDQPWYWLIPFVFLTALAGAYSAAWLSNPQSRAVDKTLYRISEVVVIVALSRVISWVLFADVIPSADELRLYLEQPVQFFLAGGFITTVMVALVAWWSAGTVNQLFTQLDVSEEELRYYTLPPAAQKTMVDDQPIQTPRQELQDAYLRNFLTGGMILVIVAALSTFEVREFATVANPLAFTRLGLEPMMLIILLLYFLIGIWLLSHARLLRLNARWLVDGVAMDASFERSWQRTALRWLLLIAVIAAFLPIGNTVPIARLLGLLVNGMLYLVNLVYRFIGFLIGSFLVALQQMVGEQPPEPTQPFDPPAFTPPPPAAEASPVAGLVLSSAFWAILVAIIIGAALFVARERGLSLGLDRVRSWLSQATSWLSLAWARLRSRFTHARRTLPDRLRNLRPVASPIGLPDTSRWRFVRINGLSPRDQILYFYLSTVKRASDSGVPRRASETPIEYAQDLKQNWPETELEIDDLTTAFIEARYSPREIDDQSAGSVKTLWKRLRERLRGSGRSPSGPASS